ncbi:MAG: 3-coathanger stack domain-containing protein [Bacteroidota bacterium]
MTFDYTFEALKKKVGWSIFLFLWAMLYPHSSMMASSAPTITLVAAQSSYTGHEGDTSLSLALDYTAVGATVTNFSGQIDGSETTAFGSFPFADKANHPTCFNGYTNGNVPYDLYQFQVTQSGIYTFTAQAGTLNETGVLYQNNFSAAATCNNWLGATRWVDTTSGQVQNQRLAISKNLTAGINYFFTCSPTFLPSTGSYDFDIAGPNSVFIVNPSNFSYTYAVVDQSGNIAEFDAASDLTDRPVGTYTVYAITHPTGVNIAAYVGSSYTSFLADLTNSIGGSASNNSINVTITVNQLCPIFGSLTGNNTVCLGTSLTHLTIDGLTNMGSENGVKFVYSTTQTSDVSAIYNFSNVLGIVSNADLTNSKSNATLSDITNYPSTPGTYYIYAVLTPTPSAVSCRPFLSTTLTVHPAAPAANAGSYSAVCANGNNTLLTGSPMPSDGATGIWSGSGVTDDGAGSPNGTFTPNNLNGSIPLTYTYTDGNGCRSSATTSITVNTLSATVSTGNYGPIREDAADILLTGSPDPQVNEMGTWSGPGISDANQTDNFAEFDPSGLTGSVTVTYTFIDANGCSQSASTTVLVSDSTPQSPNCRNKKLSVTNPLNNQTYLCDTILSNSTLPTTSTITFQACDEIVLKTGFHAGANTTFTARIGSCGVPSQSANSRNKEYISTNQLKRATALFLSPNPARSRVNITYELEQASLLQIELYDMVSRPIKTLLPKEYHPQGKYNRVVELPSLPKGLYLVRLQQQNFHITKKLLIVD